MFHVHFLRAVQWKGEIRQTLGRSTQPGWKGKKEKKTEKLKEVRQGKGSGKEGCKKRNKDGRLSS